MPLEPPALDDLTWDDLMQAARSRIPGASGGHWTLHAPVDPGITLLELYAALLEQRLFWMDQPCDARQRALIHLLGSGPRPVISATTVLAITGRIIQGDDAPIEDFPQIPAGTVLTLRPAVGTATTNRNGGPSQTPLAFSTRDALTLLPMQGSPARPGRRGVTSPSSDVGLIVGGADRTLDLHAGRAPELVAARPGPEGGASEEVEIILRLKCKVPPGTTGTFALLLDLLVPPGIPPVWSPDAATDVPPPREVTWAYRSDPDRFQEFDPRQVEDGTAGLRRPGLVRLPIPRTPAWFATTPTDGAGGFAYALRLRAPLASGGVRPRVRQVVPNGVAAGHRRRLEFDMTEERLARQLAAWLRLPGNVLDLPEAEGPPIPATVRLQLEEWDGTVAVWEPAADLARSGPGDRHFVVDRDAGRLRFGDGLQGRLPTYRARVNFDSRSPMRSAAARPGTSTLSDGGRPRQPPGARSMWCRPRGGETPRPPTRRPDVSRPS